MKKIANALHLNILKPIEWALILVVIIAGSLLYWDYTDVETPKYEGEGDPIIINAEQTQAQAQAEVANTALENKTSETDGELY